jgi:hypothetical protein
MKLGDPLAFVARAERLFVEHECDRQGYKSTPGRGAAQHSE